MLSIRLLRGIGSRLMKKDSLRKFSQSTKHEPNTPKETPAQSQTSNGRNLGVAMMQPSEFEKKILVWVKRFPSKDKIPERIAVQTMAQAQTRARIKACNYMIVFCIIGFITAAMIGRRGHDEEFDLTDKILQKHKKE